MTDIYIAKDGDKHRLVNALRATEMPYRVTIKKGGTRSLSQNAYLWGVVYPVFLLEGGLADQGWQKDDIHEYFLGECFGWNQLSGFGMKRLKPMQRSSNLSKTEFVDYVAFIQQKAAEMGLYVPDPDEEE